MSLQALIIRILYNSKQRVHIRIKACAIRAFERLEILETAITQLSQIRMRCDLLSKPSDGVQRRTHLSSSRCASIAADFPRQINQRNDDGNCADDLADCTNRFPIH